MGMPLSMLETRRAFNGGFLVQVEVKGVGSIASHRFPRTYGRDMFIGPRTTKTFHSFKSSIEPV